MSGRAKIEKLTHAWYGFALFSGLMSVLGGGFGPVSLVISIFFAVLSTAFSFFVTFLIGRALMHKSGLTRLVLLFLSAILGVLSVLASFKLVGRFFGDWSLGLLMQAAMSALVGYMQLRSFAVLRDREVRAYFG